jgi:hypothetical protein
MKKVGEGPKAGPARSDAAVWRPFSSDCYPRTKQLFQFRIPLTPRDAVLAFQSTTGRGVERHS